MSKFLKYYNIFEFYALTLNLYDNVKSGLGSCQSFMEVDCRLSKLCCLGKRYWFEILKNSYGLTIIKKLKSDCTNKTFPVALHISKMVSWGPGFAAMKANLLGTGKRLERGDKPCNFYLFHFLFSTYVTWYAILDNFVNTFLSFFAF